MMSYLDWLHCYILHIGVFQQPRTFHLECSLNLGSDHKSSRFCEWVVFIFSSSCDTKSLCYTIILRFLLKYILKKFYQMFYWCTVLCWFQVYFTVIWHLHTLWNDHCGNSSNHLSSYKFIKILLAIFLKVYIMFPWLIYFITGELYL